MKHDEDFQGRHEGNAFVNGNWGTEYPGHSVNPLRMKRNLFYLKTQSARHSKHSISVIKPKR